jgi:hypothetical protein
MEECKNSEEYLSNDQMAKALDAVLSMSDISLDFQILTELDTSSLLKKAKDGLKGHNLEWSDATKLLGVTESTIKRWQRSNDLATNAKQKIAALCLLLSYTKNKGNNNTVVTELVSLAVSKLRGGEDVDQDSNNYGFLEQSLSSIFGVSGLMAVAWYLATGSVHVGSDSDTG